MASGAITADAAGTWALGDTTVSRIGLGAMRLTGDAAFHLGAPGDRDRSIAVLRRAVDLGVDHVDTAAFSFSSLRSADELVNSVPAPYPDDLLVATEAGPFRDWSGEWGTSARPEGLRGHVEENLRRLGRDRLDLVHLRRMDQASIAEHFGAPAELRRAGLVRHLGISGVAPRHLAEAQAIAPVVAVQNRHGLGGRPPATEELLRLCRDQGIAFVPFCAIAGESGPRGATTAHGEAVQAAARAHGEAVQAAARAHGASPAQIRSAWILAQGRTSWPSPAPATPSTSSRTWRRDASGWRRRNRTA